MILYFNKFLFSYFCSILNRFFLPLPYQFLNLKKAYKIFAWTLLLVHSLWIVRVCVPIIFYYTHQQYIATNLCENVAKPAMKCNGKCYLKKQLAATEKSSENNKSKSEVKVCFEELQIHSTTLPSPVFSTVAIQPYQIWKASFYAHFLEIHSPPPQV